MLHIVWLTGIWLILTSEFSAGNFALGLLLATGMVALVTRAAPNTSKIRFGLGRIYEALDLFAFFLWEVLVSGITVAIEVLRPQMRLKPAVVAIPIKGYPPGTVLMLANLITMTPGTLSLYADEEAELLYVHSMRVDDVEEFRRGIQQTLARRVEGVMR